MGSHQKLNIKRVRNKARPMLTRRYNFSCHIFLHGSKYP